MSEAPSLYPGGFGPLLSRLEKRQLSFAEVEAVLPPADVDIAPMFRDLVPAPSSPHQDFPRYSAARKWAELHAEFAGQPKILHLHAMLIAISRRESPPDTAVSLFFRIWKEHGEVLATLLTARWLISAATTFSDIGQTADQRAGGMALSILFDAMKLHDSERRFSGQPGRTPFRNMKSRKKFPVAFGLDPYSFNKGDLDEIMLARIWKVVDRDPVIRPLGMQMLRMVMTEPRSIFGRVRELKDQHRAWVKRQ